MQTNSYRERKILWYKICKANGWTTTSTIPQPLPLKSSDEGENVDEPEPSKRMYYNKVSYRSIYKPMY